MSDAASAIVAVFLDTNCFIEARDLKDLPWRDLFPQAHRVDLLVAPTVVDELDQLKADRRQRVRDRSRLALAAIREAGRQPDMRRTLRDADGLRVELVVADVGRVDWEANPGLDPARADDRLVGEALAHAGDGVAVLLSHDTGPLLRGRRVGLPTLELPADWLLPPVADEGAKEVSRLQRENAELRNRFPDLRVQWQRDDRAIDSLVVERLVLPPLRDVAIRELMARTEALHPRRRGVFSPSLGFSIAGELGHTQGAYERYSADHDSFVQGLPAFFEKLHERFATVSPTTCVEYLVANDGSATAEGLTVQYELEGDWLLMADEDAARSFYGVSVVPPAVPEPPRPRSAGDSMLRGLSPLSMPPRPRDPTGFYWEHRPGGADGRGSLRCEEFRAKRSRLGEVWVYPWNGDDVGATVHLDVHHRTGAGPIRRELSLDVAARKVGWDDPRVQRLADGWLAEVLVDPLP